MSNDAVTSAIIRFASNREPREALSLIQSRMLLHTVQLDVDGLTTPSALTTLFQRSANAYAASVAAFIAALFS